MTRGATTVVPGRVGEALPVEARRSDFYAGILLVGLLVVVLVVRRAGAYIRRQLVNYFRYTPSSRNDAKDPQLAQPRPYIPLRMLNVLLCATLCFGWIDSRCYYVYNNEFQPILLFATLLGCWACYECVYAVLHRWIHWVFFSPAAHHAWLTASRTVSCLEGFLLYGVTTVAFCVVVPWKVAASAFIVVEVVCKLLLLYKVKSIFFNGFYGYFHLLLYLCALETAPLLFLLKILIVFAVEIDFITY